ncbi:hypothetical protein [Alkalihalobacillus sp. AL-G]|uniref:hypothetical protein n=1 Tax=Alkalihalobacillus sp. AL-G TaxID=2926399 RepID=UPI00272B4E03|nr:hypothetical protein [Alkalihalobacillus sp. AL-G]WLD94917.1 hypothetical protein MOJ78_08555 [Alkalihalobacillus sp. AL-G]
MQFFIDLTLMSICIIGLTAFMGIITHGAALRLFGKNSRRFFAVKSKQTQTGWRKVQRRDT